MGECVSCIRHTLPPRGQPAQSNLPPLAPEAVLCAAPAFCVPLPQSGADREHRGRLLLTPNAFRVVRGAEVAFTGMLFTEHLLWSLCRVGELDAAFTPAAVRWLCANGVPAEEVLARVAAMPTVAGKHNWDLFAATVPTLAGAAPVPVRDSFDSAGEELALPPFSPALSRVIHFAAALCDATPITTDALLAAMLSEKDCAASIAITAIATAHGSGVSGETVAWAMGLSAPAVARMHRRMVEECKAEMEWTTFLAVEGGPETVPSRPAIPPHSELPPLIPLPPSLAAAVAKPDVDVDAGMAGARAVVRAAAAGPTPVSAVLVPDYNPSGAVPYPARVYMGAYPYPEHMAPLLAAGVTVFVNLTEESDASYKRDYPATVASLLAGVSGFPPPSLQKPLGLCVCWCM